MIIKRWRKMRLVVAVSLVGLCGTAWAEPVVVEGFDSGVKGWSVWTARKQTAFTADAAAGKVTVTNLLEQIAVYRYLTLEPGRRYALRFRYKTRDIKVAPGGNIGAGASFNKAGGANGSAGRVALGIPVDTADSDWRLFAGEFKVPVEAAKIQLSILAMRLVTGTIWIDDITLEPIRDEVTIKRAGTPPMIDGDLDDACWSNGTPLDDFTRIHLDPAPPTARTQAYLSYDDTRLYVAFRNEEPSMAMVKCLETKRDGNVWSDDCNEVFIVSPAGRKVQLAVNTADVQWDAELYAKMPGDPYQPNVGWNAEWTSAVRKGSNSWTSEFAIPLVMFEDHPHPGAIWRINVARERVGAAVELSQWHRIDGTFNVVDKFGTLEFRADDAVLKRFVETKVQTPFRIRREAPQFQSLLGDVPGHYLVGSWGLMTAMPGHYPKALKARFTPALWQQERTNIMTELGEAGMFGTQIQYVPDPEVWAARYGMKHWLYLQKFGTTTNATYTDPVHHRVDSIDPAYVDAVVKGTRQYFVETPQAPRSLAFALGKDEPMNATAFVFSKTRNPKAHAMLEAVDQEIKTQFGFGRYGMPDAFAPKPPEDEPFRRIAFMRWWNTRFAACTDTIGKAFREAAPGVPYLAANYNHTRSIGDEDVALLAPHTDWVGGDPYPTSTLGLYGRARALYQTGFSTKYLRDVSGGRKTCVTPQAFKYFGQEPAPDDIREWASQALKNGGDVLFWYNEGPSRMVVPAAYKEMLRVCNIVRKMNRLNRPAGTRTAVLFSNTSAWGNKDEAKHSWYSLYAILGEKAGTWFRFVSDTQMALDPDALAGCRLLYLPQLKYADATTAARIVAFVEGGGTLVVSDPQAFAWSLEGTPLADTRSRLLGGSLGSARSAEHLVIANGGYLGLAPGTRLPLTPVMHREEAGRIMAYDITPPPDARVIAYYADGAPAAYERQVAKGRVIAFAAQPFGNSDLAVEPGAWRDLCVALAKEAREPVGLKIWDFELPASGEDVPVTYAVKPDQAL